VARDLDLDFEWDDLLLPSAPRDPNKFAELAELLELGGSADRILASLRGDR
jgi:hypothetical protein